MEIGNKVKVIDNLLNNSYIGTVTEIKICYFRIILENGNIITYHWNDDIEIENL
jgi:hypothetical protein